MIRLPAERSDAISAAIREVTRRSQTAELATNTEDARKALTAVRDAVLTAADLINTAEREAREGACGKLEHAA